MHIYQEENKIIIAEGKSQVWIEAWGANSLRVRMTALPKMDENDWALTEKMESVEPQITFDRSMVQGRRICQVPSDSNAGADYQW